MRLLADDVLIAALAVAQQRHQVGLGAGREEQRSRFTAQARRFSLQRIDGGIIAIDIIAGFGRHHRIQHRGTRAGHGITA